MNFDRVELLAPSGDWEAFLAAVENGADAVYLGGKLFNARQFASNFDGDKLAEALKYAHVRGVCIYLTMNTLMSDEELFKAVEFLKEAYLAGIDGVIVQDMGFVRLIKSLFPDLPIHASTQMTVYNIDGVRLLEQIGFERVVLARELSLEEIKNITSNTSTEIEVFVHGALCISYSGQCLMSSIIGGRSGNRGKCAQPCRLPFELVGNDCGKVKVGKCKGSYIMSPKDLCSVQILNKIIDAGVKSLKIEGRMKGPEYVGTVTRVYRKYIERLETHKEGTKGQYVVEDKDLSDLTQIFNRGGFSKGYLEGKTGSSMMSYEKPKNWGIWLGNVVSYDRALKAVKLVLKTDISIGDGIEVWNGEEESPGTVVTGLELNGKRVDTAKAGDTVWIKSVKGNISKDDKVYKTSDKKLNNSALETASGKFYRKVPVRGNLSVRRNQPIFLELTDDMGNNIVVNSSFIPEEAVNRPITKERLLEQINKTGNTPFEFEDILIELDGNLALPISEINNIRRSALEQLEIARATVNLRKLSEDFDEKQKALMYFPGNSRNKDRKLKISACIYKFNDKIDYGSLSVDRFYLPFGAMLTKKGKSTISHLRSKGHEVYIFMPSITRGNYDNLIASGLNEIIDIGIDGLLVGNIGLLGKEKFPSGIDKIGDYSLNCFNSSSLMQFAEMGLKGITLSLELTLNQIRKLAHIPNLAKEAVVYGRIPVMTSEYCPAGSIAGGFDAKTKCSAVCQNGEHYLKDRMGAIFPIVCDRVDCRSTIFNSNVLLLEESIDEIKQAGVDVIRLNFTDETYDEMVEISQLHTALVQKGKEALKQYDRLVDKIKKKGFTKGHYFRGV